MCINQPHNVLEHHFNGDLQRSEGATDVEEERGQTEERQKRSERKEGLRQIQEALVVPSLSVNMQPNLEIHLLYQIDFMWYVHWCSTDSEYTYSRNCTQK